MVQIELSGFKKYFPLAILAIMTVFGIMLLYNNWHEELLFPKIFIIIWLLILLITWYRTLNMLVKATVGNGRVIFTNLMNNEYEFAVSEIQKISISHSTLKIETSGKTIHGRGEFDGMSVFIQELRKFNPDIITKGC